MDNKSAHEIYQRFVQAIDKATVEKNIYSVPRLAEDIGMSGGVEPRGLGERWDYSYRDDNGVEVLVHARWWDQSKPFSLQPDKHVMSVELRGDGESRYHSDSYEE